MGEKFLETKQTTTQFNIFHTRIFLSQEKGERESNEWIEKRDGERITQKVSERKKKERNRIQKEK